MIQSGVAYRIISNQLGSVRLMVRAVDGYIVQRTDYDEFGIVQAGEYIEPGFKEAPVGFAGGLYDPDTKLVRFSARDYDPDTGRWMTKDPIRFGGGVANLYEFVLDDPINSYDPFGISEIRISGSIAVLRLSGGQTIALEVGNNTTNPHGDPNTVGSHGPAPNGTFPVGRPGYYKPGDEGYNIYGPAFFPIGLGTCSGNPDSLILCAGDRLECMVVQTMHQMSHLDVFDLATET